MKRDVWRHICLCCGLDRRRAADRERIRCPKCKAPRPFFMTMIDPYPTPFLENCPKVDSKIVLHSWVKDVLSNENT